MSLRTATTRISRTSPLRLATSLPSSRASFFSLPGLPGSSASTTQHLTATRTLPYPIPALYTLISDVDSYSSFVPYCSTSKVTQWSKPDPEHDDRRWPTQADLHVGWGGFNEVFTSRLRCVPNVSVEAVSGGPQEAASAVFRSLVTRWSLREATRPSHSQTSSATASPATEVHLSLKYEFANPLYAAVSAAVSDKVAGMMIEAFEQRAREQLGHNTRRKL